MSILRYIERIKRENEGPRITARDGGSMPEHLTKMKPKIDDDFWINHYRQVLDARLGAMEEIRKRGGPLNPDDAEYLFKQYNELKKYGGDTTEFDQRIKNLSPPAKEPEFAADGGRIGQLVRNTVDGSRPGYADKKSSWNLGKGNTGIPHLYRNRGSGGYGKGFLVKGQRGKIEVLKYFTADEFEEAKAFAKKTEEKLAKIPVETRHLSGQKLTIANQYAEDFFGKGKEYKTLNLTQRARIKAKMFRREGKFSKKSMFDLPSATNQEKIKNAFPDVEFDFKPGQKHGVPFLLKNGKRNPAFTAVVHFISRGHTLPKQNIKKLPVSMQREIVSTFELPPGQEWNFDITRGGTRYGIAKVATGENQPLYERIKYFTKEPRNFKVAADFASPDGWLLSQMYRAWDDGHESYKPIYDMVNGKKRIVGFTDNQFGKGKTYFGLKKYTKKFNGTPMSNHPDFKNTKKFIDIANRAKLPPNKVITDLLIKGGIEDNRVTLNTLLHYMVNEKGVEPTKRALVLHHKGGAKTTPTRDFQILNRAVNQNIMGVEMKMRQNPKHITPKNIQFLKDAGASITINGKTYGGGPKSAIGGFRQAEKLVQSTLEGFKKKDFNELTKYLQSLGCPGKGAAEGGRISFDIGGSTTCITRGLEKLKNPTNLSPGDQANIRALKEMGKGAKGARTFGNMARVLGKAGIVGELAFGGLFALTDYAGGANKQEILSNFTYGLAGKSQEEQLKEKDPLYGRPKEIIGGFTSLQDMLKREEAKSIGKMSLKPGAIKQQTTVLEEKMKPFIKEGEFEYDLFAQQEAADAKTLLDFEKEKAERKLKRKALSEFDEEAFAYRGFMGGGMVGIRKPDAIPPERQGLRSIMINGKKS